METGPHRTPAPEGGPETTVLRGDQTVFRNEDSISQGRETPPSADTPVEVDEHRILKSRFVLEERIGSGGMGSVFRAKDLRKVEARDNQPYVAVKVLNNDFRQHPEAFIALEREASKSQTLRHSNIVSIFDFDKDGDIPYITMELLEGQELAELLQSYPNGLPEEQAWPIIEGMVLGLMHAHEEGVVHADFKPGNVYVTHRQSTKILDFGIARAMRANSGGDDTDFDPSRLAALTPAYASREMLNGDNAEPRDDLYSLGVVIYMVLTGLHPYGRVPANEAIKENLHPERIKQLSRRRWRILERCLAFNRQDRPATAHDLYEGLFGKTHWRSWGIAAAALIVSASILFASLQETAEINVVKEEVRTETLVTAQVNRIHDLLEEPRFDTEWVRILFSEVQTLRTVSPDDVAVDAMLEKIAATYAQAVADSNALDESFRLYHSALQLGAAQASAQVLESRLLSSIHHLGGQPLDAQWLADAEQTLSYLQRDFSGSLMLREAKGALLDNLFVEIAAVFAGEHPGDVGVAEQAWNTFAGEIPDEVKRNEIESLLDLALAKAARQKADEEAARLRSSLLAQMNNILQVSCLRLDLEQVASALEGVGRKYPGQLDLVQAQAARRISECVAQVGAVDAERGRSMQRQAQSRFAELANFTDLDVDPCSMHYLVGNGRQQGAGGSCADDLGDDSSAPALKGPRLVVVPDAQSSGKFAISKYEISWRDFNNFCQETGECAADEERGRSVKQDTRPVTGVDVSLVERYAQWLSAKTGYHYRLPTRAEWFQVAQAFDLSNKCLRVSREEVRSVTAAEVQIVEDNRFGVVDILNNVGEIVKDADGYLTLDGVLQDAQGRCLLRTGKLSDTQGDQSTGFRLVREVS